MAARDILKGRHWDTAVAEWLAGLAGPGAPHLRRGPGRQGRPQPRRLLGNSRPSPHVLADQHIRTSARDALITFEASQPVLGPGGCPPGRHLDPEG